MSRLGKQPIQLPEKVTATYAEGVLTIKGPKGELSRTIKNDVLVTLEGSQLTFAPAKNTKESKALWGTWAAHVRNMVTGVTEGFKKVLEIEGVGYRAEAQGNKIKILAGFSHPVELVITVTGIDVEAVGQFAANIRGVKEPEPYKGKGIHYVGEYIIRKQGKKGVA